MSKKQPPLKSTKPPPGSSLSGGFFWKKEVPINGPKSCTENLHQKYMAPLCMQSETESCRLRDTVFNVRAGQAKPHMQRDALPKAHPNTIYGKSEKQC